MARRGKKHEMWSVRELKNPKMWCRRQNMVGGVNTPGKRKYQRFETFNQEEDTHVLAKEINRKMCRKRTGLCDLFVTFPQQNLHNF